MRPTGVYAIDLLQRVRRLSGKIAFFYWMLFAGWRSPISP